MNKIRNGMNRFRGGINFGGIVWAFLLIAMLWYVCFKKAIEEYFIPRGGIELGKLIIALLGAGLILAFYLLSGNRDWLEAQREAIDWGADKAIEIVKEIEKVGVKSFKEVHNIGLESASESYTGEGIGED